MGSSSRRRRASISYQYTNIKSRAQCLGAVAGGIQGQSEMGGVQGVLGQAGSVTFQGAPYRAPDGAAFTGPNGFDMNAGVEFRILKQLNLWFQMNNIFNDKYERWHQYPGLWVQCGGGDRFFFWGKITIVSHHVAGLERLFIPAQKYQYSGSWYDLSGNFSCPCGCGRPDDPAAGLSFPFRQIF